MRRPPDATMETPAGCARRGLRALSGLPALPLVVVVVALLMMAGTAHHHHAGRRPPFKASGRRTRPPPPAGGCLCLQEWPLRR